MKKEFVGVSGAARINQLTRADLSRAERHGKRQDMTGQSRAINDDPPVTTTGLELNALFEAHVAGAFVPKAHSKAMHILIQFPTDLVDGDDAKGMLRHARAFTQRVFSDSAIFADRVDRDEKSQHVVDLFVAPRYIKKTKREEKVAVSMTHHLKALASEYGQPTGPHGCARALQTALYEYLRDEMGLADVRRGSPKQMPGPDWKSSEQQRVEELDDLRAQAQAGYDDIQRDRFAAQADRDAAATTRAMSEIERLSVADDRRVLELDREYVARRSEELDRREQQAKDAEDALCVARAEVQRKQNAVMIAATAAKRAAEGVQDKAIAAAKKEAAADAECAKAARLTAQAVAERAALVEERAQREAELALLMKAGDDDNGLALRPVEDGIIMNEGAMDGSERSTFRRPWPIAVRVLAMKLAKVLEQVRDLTRGLLEREARVASKEAELKAQKQENARELEERRVAQRAEHEESMLALTLREDVMNANEVAAARVAAAAHAQMTAAIKVRNAANDAVSLNEHWAKAVDVVGQYPAILIHDDDGGFRLDPRTERTGRLPDWLKATLQQPAPTWATVAITGLHQLELMTERVETREREAAHHIERLQDMIEEAGPTLRPTQLAVVEQASSVIRQISHSARQRDEGHAV